MTPPTTIKENKMGTMPVNKLLIQVALPIIISMTIQGLYNVIDSIFVARINENALNAVSLAFPVQNIMISVSVGLSVGMNSILSRSLGEGNRQKATDTALNTLFLTGVLSLGCFLFAVFGVNSFFASQTTIPEILHYGQDYLMICCSMAFSLFFTITLERTLQATGQTTYTMISQGAGAITNIILDPILIFGLCGFPRLEVRGAAIATVIGQTVSLLLNIYFNLKRNPDLSFNFKGFRLNWALNKEIAAIAIPSMAMGASASILVYYLNQLLLGISTTATAVLGVYFKLQSFVYMPIFGLTNGMIPILAYNFGAKEYTRFMDTLKLSLFYAMAMMLTGMFLFQTYPESLFRLFQDDNGSPELLAMGAQAIKIISYAFPVAAVCIVGSSVFQALGHGSYSLISTTIRQIIVQLPMAYLLAEHFSALGVWYSFILAESVAVLCIIGFFIYLYKGEIEPMKPSLTKD